MNQKIINLQTDLNEQLNFIDLEIDNEIKRCEKAIEITLKAKENLKNVVIKSQFKSQNEEIYFFKEIKPQFTSKIIYYKPIARNYIPCPQSTSKQIYHKTRQVLETCLV